MRDMTEIRREIEEILNIHTYLKGKEMLIMQLLELIQREQNKSYDNGYKLKSQKRAP
jgi:hypothetical protein